MKSGYNIRQACFVCTTPYQIIGAISIVLAKKLEADIFICSTFSSYNELASRLKDMKIFQNVYSIDCNAIKPALLGIPSRLATWIMPLLQIIKPERYVSRVLSRDIVYNTLYISSRAHVKMILYSALQNRNPEMKIVFFDDGLGSYQKNSHVLNASKLRRWTESLLGINKILNPKLISIQLYLNKISQLPQYLKKCPVKQMPSVNDFLTCH